MVSDVVHSNCQKSDMWVHEDQRQHQRVGGTREEFLVKFQGCIMMGTIGRMGLVRVGCPLAMLCHVDGTRSEQGNDSVD
jgi:hypothetical protein